MKKFSTFTASILAICIVVLNAGTGKLSAEAAETAGFSMSGGTQTSGATFPVTVYEDSGATPINVISLELNYDPSKLQLVSIDDPAIEMANASKPEADAGMVKIARYRISPLTGKIPFAVINFKALANSGSTSITVGEDSIIFYGRDNIWNGDTTGAMYTFTAPVVAAPKSAKTPTPAKRSVAAAPQAQPMPKTPAPTTLGAETTTPPAAQNQRAVDTQTNIQPIQSSPVTARTTLTSQKYQLFIYPFALIIAVAVIMASGHRKNMRNIA